MEKFIPYDKIGRFPDFLPTRISLNQYLKVGKVRIRLLSKSWDKKT